MTSSISPRSSPSCAPRRWSPRPSGSTGRSRDEAIGMPVHPPLRLGVNIDHVATVRNARGGQHPDPVQGRRDRDRGRRRRHHRAFARGPPPHPRRRHGAAQRRTSKSRSISKWRRPRRWSGSRCKVRPHAACLVPERREERTTEGGLDVVGQRKALRAPVAQLARRRHSRVAVHRRRAGADRSGGRDRRAGDRNSHRRLVRRGRRRRRRGRRRGMGAHRARRGAGGRRPASKSMPATASIIVTAETIAALPEIVELNIGHFLIGEALFVGLGEAVRKMRAAMDRGRRVVRGQHHDHRHRLRHERRAPHRQGDRAPRRPLSRPHLHRRRARQGGAPRTTGSRPMPSALPPRRPAPRRSAPGCAPASGGATWGWSICRAGGRP